MGQVLTDLNSAQVRLGVNKLYGTIATTPMLLLSDGGNLSYVADVNISELDPTGEINQFKSEEDKPVSALLGLPGQPPEDWQLDQLLPGGTGTVMHNVPIARNNNDLRYAAVDAPVVLTRTERGLWEISNFSAIRPGTHKLYGVDLGDMTIGTVIDLTVTSRLLTLAEFGEWQPFGALALGASATFKGNELIRVS